MGHLSENMKHIIDVIAGIIAGVAVAVSHVIPTLAALASLIWYGIRIYNYLKGKDNGDKRND